MKLRTDDIPTMRREYDYQNLECARIYAAEPQRYPGVLQTWAALVVERLKDLPPRKGQKGLFS